MLLSAEQLSINFGSRQLLENVNFYLNENDKVGIIGINGTGKSTFLKVLAGFLEPDGGKITRNPNVQVLHPLQGRRSAWRLDPRPRCLPRTSPALIRRSVKNGFYFFRLQSCQTHGRPYL